MTRDRWMDAAAAGLIGIAALSLLREWKTTPNLTKVATEPEPMLALPAPREAICSESIWETFKELGIRVPEG